MSFRSYLQPRQAMSGKSRRRRRGRLHTACVGCGNPLTTNRASVMCKPCDGIREKAVARYASKPVPPVRYIAGYVPPKGSIVMALLHTVHPPIRGLGM